MYVKLSVSDTGKGMAPEVRSRIFEPFFTTKEIGNGTGLGLSTVFGVVTQSGGTISVSSEQGRGTAFTIHLPRVATDKVTPPAMTKVGQQRGSGETILVVEDEDGVRALVQRILVKLGYTVLVAYDAEEAIRVATRHPGPIDLLLTDVIMPGMSGIRLTHEIRLLRPGIRSLFMSGYTVTEIDRTGALAENTMLLEKPFTSERLAHAVRAALGEDAKA